MFYVAKKTKALISSKVPRIWPRICKSKSIRGVAHISPCVALRIITDRAVKQVLFHSISQPFSNMDLALSREVSRNGQRIITLFLKPKLPFHSLTETKLEVMNL